MIIAGLDLSKNGSGCTKFYLDDSFNVVKRRYLAFTTVKMFHDEALEGSVLHYREKDFNNHLCRYDWMYTKMIEFLSDVDYISIEGYSYNSIGKYFDLAEFAGTLKYKLFKLGKKLRVYEPTVIKMFATGNGSAKKPMMEEYYEKEKEKFDLSFFPNVSDREDKNPKCDIVDSFFICRLLLVEMKLRYGIVTMKDLNVEEIKVFNRVTKKNPINILASEFLEIGS